jgi:hypothetical protein
MEETKDARRVSGADELTRGLTLALALTLAVGCGGGTTAPSTGYDGQWSGTTSQATEITFTVSNQSVTAITFGYNLRNCTGTKTATSLNVVIATRSPSLLPGVPDGPGFIYFSKLGPPDENFVEVVGMFTANNTASGSVFYASCATPTVLATEGFTWKAEKK